MGLILERSGMAEDLLDTIGQLFGPVRGGLAYAVIFVGALLDITDTIERRQTVDHMSAIVGSTGDARLEAVQDLTRPVLAPTARFPRVGLGTDETTDQGTTRPRDARAVS